MDKVDGDAVKTELRNFIFACFLSLGNTGKYRGRAVEAAATQAAARTARYNLE